MSFLFGYSGLHCALVATDTHITHLAPSGQRPQRYSRMDKVLRAPLGFVGHAGQLPHALMGAQAAQAFLGRGDPTAAVQAATHGSGSAPTLPVSVYWIGATAAGTFLQGIASKHGPFGSGDPDEARTAFTCALDPDRQESYKAELEAFFLNPHDQPFLPDALEFLCAMLPRIAAEAEGQQVSTTLRLGCLERLPGGLRASSHTFSCGAAPEPLPDPWTMSVLPEPENTAVAIIQNAASSPTSCVRLDSGATLPSGLRCYFDMANEILGVNDGSYDRVKMGHIGSEYGFQIMDSAGIVSMDAARSDGRLYMQIGGADSRAPVALMCHSNSGLSRSGSLASLDSYSLPANALTNNGDILRVRVVGRCASGSTSNAVYIHFGASSLGVTPGANGLYFEVQAIIRRIGPSSQFMSFKMTSGDGSAGTTTMYASTTSPSEDLTGAVTVAVYAGAASSTVYLDTITMEYIGLA